MVRTFIIFLLSISIANAFGQNQNIGNEKMPNHQNIKGTQVWLVPPVGFVLSTDYKGFKDTTDKMSMIMVTEMKGPYSEISKAFDGSRPLPNIEVKETKNLQIGKHNATSVTIEQSANGLIFKKIILIIDDSTQTVMINSIFLKDSVALGTNIEKSMQSVFYDDNQIVDSRGSLDYTIDEVNTNLKFSSVMGNAMIFTLDGKTPTQAKNKLSFVIDKSYANAEISNQKMFCLSRLKKMSYESTKIDLEKGLKEVEIGGLKGYELFAKAYKKEGIFQECVYQIILFAPKNYFIMLGTYEDETSENIETLKKITRTFKLK